jgi:hypothetical protein
MRDEKGKVHIVPVHLSPSEIGFPAASQSPNPAQNPVQAAAEQPKSHRQQSSSAGWNAGAARRTDGGSARALQ